MKNIKNRRISNQKVTIVSSVIPNPSDGQINYLFTFKQITKIVKDFSIRKIPFSNPAILGITEFNNGLLPVISLEQCLGIHDSAKEEIRQLIVIKTGVKPDINADDSIIAFVSHSSVHLSRFPEEARPDNKSKFIPKSECVHGIYKYNEGYLIIVNLEEIINKLKVGLPLPGKT